MKSKLGLSLLFLIWFQFNSAQTSQNNKFNYGELWDKITAMEIAGLPRSALPEVDKIYKYALSEKNTEQIIKSLIFKMKFSYAFEADNYAKQILNLEEDLKKISFPDSAIVHSMLGEMYWIYFQRNRYRFYGRTSTIDYKPDDLKTWSLEQIFGKARQHYLLSLKAKDLLYGLKTNSLINEIIKPGFPENFQFTTLYDFLAFRAIDFLRSDELEINEFTSSFKLDNERFFDSPDKFLKLDLDESKTTPNTLQALCIFQDVLNKHKKEGNQRDFALAELHRLNFVSNKSTHHNKQALYINALENILTDTNKHVDLWAEINYHRAKAIYNRGHKYSRKTSEKYRWDYRNSLNICEDILTKQQNIDKWTIENCRELISKINSKSLSVKTENVVLPNQSSPALISYKNVDSLYVRIIRTAYEQYDSLQLNLRKKIDFRERQSYQKLLADTLQKFEIYQEFEYRLPNVTDYRQHSVEAILPKLPKGQYVFLFSANPTFTYSENELIISFLSVSNLSFINRPDKNGNLEFIVLHRQSGKPLSNVKVMPYVVINDYRERRTPVTPLPQQKTDSEGFVIIKSTKKGRNLTTVFELGNNRLSTKDYNQQHEYGIYTYKQRNKKKTKTKTAFFTDRAIYRPGQTVYFKGIVYETNFEKQHEIICDYSTTVRLFDVNNQKISEVEVTTNEYGAFNGSFIIPRGVLTGNMQIREKNGQKRFQVEEYKPPTFEVKINKTQGTHKLNEKVHITGTANAFSGAPIDGAKVKYTIFRRAHFPRWLYGSQAEQSAHITSGETITDESGVFELDFNAITGFNEASNQQTIYNFEIKVDITDVNGETRSATKTVPVSNVALLLNAALPQMIDKNGLDSIKLSSTNLEGEFEPCQGKITIYKLESPVKTYRKRLWNAPDTFMYVQSYFNKHLPHHQFHKENNHLTWEIEKTVIHKDFNTEVSNWMRINSATKWSSGKYMAELVATDKFGEKVHWKSYFTLYSDKEKHTPYKTTNFFYLEKKKATPGEDIELLLGTSEKEITALFELEQNGKVLDKKYINIKNRLEKISIPIKEEYSGNINLNYTFVINGRLFKQWKTITVPYSQNNINIRFETFRDKLIPGEKEQWRMKLSSNKGEKIVAEMVATMYDASLDEFKTNTFNFNLNQFWYPQLLWRSEKNFGTTNGMPLSEHWNKKHSTQNMRLDGLEWFDFGYYYKPHISEKGIQNITKGSHMFLSSAKGDKLVLSGTIRDMDNEILPGANIMVKGTKTGVVADINGKFRLEYQDSVATIQVSFIGMKTYEFKASGTTNVDVLMAYDNVAMDEVVAIAHGTQKKEAVTSSSVRIRGTAQKTQNEMFLMVENEDILYDEISPITRASEVKPPPPSTSFENISTRKNLQETAFFYPDLRTNAKGEIVIDFTLPETLTKWKMLGFAHTNDLKYGFIENELISSKDLMVVPNLPRFFREGDKVTLTSKVVNLSEKKLQGSSKLMLFDALNMQPIDMDFANSDIPQKFEVEAGQSTTVSWEFIIPGGINAVACRVAAQAGNFTDAEEKVVPILSNRMLVTETLPLWVREGQSKTFVLNKLANSKSDTRTNHSLTLEFTTNPAWYAIQALPYLMEFPHECMEQTFSRYYANSIASLIINSSPKIKQVFEAWKAEDNGNAFVSKLEQNQDLKQVLLQETPWVLEAQNETEQNKRIALLFDLNKMSAEQDKALRKLKKGQYPSGGWPWFSGGRESRYITQHIISGFGHMRKMGVISPENDQQLWLMIKKAINYLDNKIQNDYEQIRQDERMGIESVHGVPNFAIHYLYGRSFFKDIPINEKYTEAIQYFKQELKSHWLTQNNYTKGMIALALHRDGESELPMKIVRSLKEHATISDELGMYWKLPWSYFWYQAPVETQALMIELFSEVAHDQKAVDNMRVWLLKHKQTNSWKTTKATAEACYALLLNGSDWLETESKVEFELGGKKYDPKNDETIKVHAGTGHFKKTWHGSEVQPEMAQVSITKPDSGISWGGLYWQYFEQLDKITAAETPVKIEKKLFREIQTQSGKKMESITNAQQLTVGDKVIVRLVLSTDRDMEFIHLKDMRASCLEPINVMSGYKYQDGLGYYQSTKDASMNFFIDYLRKGKYVLEYKLWVSHTGNFSNGITSVQSMYAPEFSSHSEGIRVKVSR